MHLFSTVNMIGRIFLIEKKRINFEHFAWKGRPLGCLSAVPQRQGGRGAPF